jgi:hypothetical protein
MFPKNPRRGRPVTGFFANRAEQGRETWRTANMEEATCPLTASQPKKNPATAMAMTITGPSEKTE